MAPASMASAADKLSDFDCSCAPEAKGVTTRRSSVRKIHGSQLPKGDAENLIGLLGGRAPDAIVYRAVVPTILPPASSSTTGM